MIRPNHYKILCVIYLYCIFIYLPIYFYGNQKNNAGTRSLLPTVPPVDCLGELKALARAPTACPTGFNPRSLD